MRDSNLHVRPSTCVTSKFMIANSVSIAETNMFASKAQFSGHSEGASSPPAQRKSMSTKIMNWIHLYSF